MLDLSHLGQFAGFLTFAAAGISLYINSRKAGTDVVDTLKKRIDDLEAANDALAKTDLNQQRDLNDKAIEISQLRYENRNQENKLGEYYKIITDKDPQTKETLTLLVGGMNKILEKLGDAEVEVIDEK